MVQRCARARRRRADGEEPLSGHARDPVTSGAAEQTVVLPTPGRKRSHYAPALERPAAAADLSRLGGLNPLIEAANPLLAAVPQIRHALRHPDPNGLRARLREQIDGFERSARASGQPEDRVFVARYALCALLDDSATATPWGRDWAREGLVAELHGEASGADKFFALLEQMSAKPAGYFELLEFFYVCLALGFEGKYRIGEGGRQALAQARSRLYDLLTQHRPQAPAELSARWRGVLIPARRVPGALALWAAGSICALLAAGVYLGYSVALGARSDPVARQIAQLKPVPLEARASVASVAARPAQPLAGGLAAEIGRGEVVVADTPGGSLIVLKSDELFGSGSARLNAALHPAIERIADALNKVPGAIVVTGHTDDVPIRTARFPSNWELSTERARSVVALMQARLREPARLRAEGVADSEPVAPNDSTANRARNRRVAILLRSAS
ncbi:MAG TPA: type VI secretion system protein TssL, long form [Burkholderiales bacterium]|nr:type VI secretion system protein TssL, long form [Burkholderiales bacterium]